MKSGGSQRIDTIFVLIIFCIFAVSVLMVLMLGASIYQNMTEVSREGQDERTALSYIRTKVRTNDEHGRFYVSEFGGIPALVYDEEFGDRTFRTSIFHYEGSLRELFTDADLDFMPSAGIELLPLDEIDFDDLGNGLIRITTGTKSLLLYPRTHGARIPFDSFSGEEVIIE